MANRVSIPAAVVAIFFLGAEFVPSFVAVGSRRIGRAAHHRSGELQRDMLFTEGWRFHLGDDVQGHGNPAFDDSAWRTLDLPHDWSVEGAFDPKLASCTAFLPCGIGWYRKTFTVAADAKDKLDQHPLRRRDEPQPGLVQWPTRWRAAVRLQLFHLRPDSRNPLRRKERDRRPRGPPSIRRLSLVRRVGHLSQGVVECDRESAYRLPTACLSPRRRSRPIRRLLKFARS